MAFGFGKRALRKLSGISNAQRNLSKAIGVPLSHAGRQRKMGSEVGCLLVVVSAMVIIFGQILAQTGTSNSAAAAQIRSGSLPIDGELLDKIEVGHVGRFPNKNSPVYMKIVSVIDDKTVLVRTNTRNKPILIVQGIDAKNLFDGKRIDFEGEFKITKTMKDGGATYPVAEPVKKR